MFDASDDKFSDILEKVGSIHPDNFPLLTKCLVEWKAIQQNHLHILAAQRKLNNILLLYMKRRQRRLRMIADFSGPKMMCLLEHIRSPYQFLKLFRIKLSTFFELKKILYSNCDNPPRWMPEIELLLFLFWLSAGLSYKKIERHLGLSEATLVQMFKGVFERFLKNVCQVIHFPKDNHDYLSKGFSGLAESHIFGLVVGFLDSFHVSIAFPSQKDDLQYLNDMNDFSIQVQAVCDYRGALMDIAVGFPGSMLKPHVLQCTPLYLGRLLPPEGRLLLSGNGYPCLQEPICIIPPYLSPTDLQQRTFNKSHEKAQSAMVTSVGQLFNRWRRIFSKPIMYPLSDITNIIIACAMIHNIGLALGDIWPKQSRVNFNVNQEHLSLVEGQKSGEVSQLNMVHQTDPREEESFNDAETNSDIPEEEAD